MRRSEPVTHGQTTMTAPTTPRRATTLTTQRRDMAQGVARWISRIGLTPRLVWIAVAIFLCSRLALVALTAATLIYKHTPPSPENMLHAWERFDATIYGTISTHGYGSPALYRAAFFPLEPLLAWIAAPLVGGDTLLSAMLVSNLAFLGALLGMASLARLDQDSGAAVRAMVLLTCYPLAFFTFAGYSESVFLFCITWALVAIRREWWAAAYVLGVFAGLSRQVGLLLMAPFALARLKLARWNPRNLDSSALGVAGPPLGLALFCLWLWRGYGDPLAWIHAEALWRRSFALPWVGFARTLTWALHNPDVVLDRRAFIELGLALMFAVLIVAGSRRLPPGETLYCVAIWLICVSFPDATYGLISLGRLLLPLTPCFLTLALLTRRRWAFALTAIIFAAFFVYLAQYFVRGYPIL